MSCSSIPKYISRLMALLLCVLLFAGLMPVTASAAEGSCGDGLTWSFADSTLTITGSGAMTNYDEWNLPPWYSFRSDIQFLSLPEGLTRVGNMAFYDCANITAVTVPGSVMVIGELAFCKNYSMAMLNLNSGLQTIGRSAFERCESLMDLRIPGTVTAIGNNAFYMCTALTYVTVPRSVTSMGSGVFAYCNSLVRADVEASVEELPFWTFYGCGSLSSASFDGEPLNVAALQTETSNAGAVQTLPVQPPQEQPQTQPQETEPVHTEPGNTASSAQLKQNPDGSATLENTQVTKTDNTTITKTESTTVNESADDISVSTDITASVVNPEGWNEVLDQVQSAQNKTENQQDEDTLPEMDVTVYVPGDTTVPKEVLQELAGTNVKLNISTQSGSKFRIDCAGLDKEAIQDDLELSYTITLAETVPDALAGVVVYRLAFHNSSAINVEVMIRLPLENVRRTASLYQMDREEPAFLQSVLVDNEGYAHYYLSSVDKDTEYLIGMNVPGEQSSQAIVPEVLYEEYNLVDQETGVEYVITGRTSSWGMNLGQVMGILAVVMVSVIVIVGFVMYTMNKRRLKNGYIPQWDDEDYE